MLKSRKLKFLFEKTNLLLTFLTIFLSCTISHAQPGSLDFSFDPGTGTDLSIYTTSIQSDGKIIIGGGFTSYNGIIRNSIARLNVDGSLDTAFDPGMGANGSLQSISIQPDGKIIIAGTFTTYDGIARNNIARVNPDGSLDISFDPGSGANNTVWTTSIQNDGKIIIGGQFTSYNATVINNLARLNSDGSFDASFNLGTGANNYVYISTTQSDGKILIGGIFTSYNGISRAHIARLNVDGSLDTSFDPGSGADSEVWTISIQPDGKIIVGGNFLTYNGTIRNFIARVNIDGSLDTFFDVGIGADNPIQTISIQNDGKIVIGGWFTSYNAITRNNIARLNEDGTLDMSFDPGIGSNDLILSAIIQNDGKIIISGYFTTYNGSTRNHVARLEGTTAGIDQLTSVDNIVTLFPNPFNNTTTLHSEVELKNATLTVSNSFDQTVKQISNISGNSIILNRDNLPAGLYFIQLSQDDQTIMNDKLVITD